MLPMITVAGIRHSRLFNPRWARAVAPTQWWQGTTAPVRSAPAQVRSGCYKTSGNCRAGEKLVGYDGQGHAVCCPGMTGPLVRNPPPPPTPYEECRAFCYDHPEIKNCISTHCAWLKSAEPKGAARQPKRAMSRMMSSARRRGVSVGEAAWKKAGSCCASCFEGKACEGGCGAACTCGKEGPKRQLNAMTILAGDLAFSPPTTSRLLNRARARLTAPGLRGQGCWKTLNGKKKYVIPCPDTKFR